MLKLFEDLLGITAKNEEIARLCNVITQVSDNCNKRVASLQAEHFEEIRNVEKALEGTIDDQFRAIQSLRHQLKAKDFNSQNEGKFYVFNPDADKPRKTYTSYQAALDDAKDVSKIENKPIQVLKVLSTVSVSESIVDETLLDDAEVPF